MYNTFAATPAGHEVCTTAEVVDVDGKRVDFKVPASDGIEEIGSGTTTNCDRSLFFQRAPCQKEELLTRWSA